MTGFSVSDESFPKPRFVENSRKTIGKPLLGVGRKTSPIKLWDSNLDPLIPPPPPNQIETESYRWQKVANNSSEASNLTYNNNGYDEEDDDYVRSFRLITRQKSSFGDNKADDDGGGDCSCHRQTAISYLSVVIYRFVGEQG